MYKSAESRKFSQFNPGGENNVARQENGNSIDGKKFILQDPGMIALQNVFLFGGRIRVSVSSERNIVENPTVFDVFPNNSVTYKKIIDDGLPKGIRKEVSTVERDGISRTCYEFTIDPQIPVRMFNGKPMLEGVERFMSQNELTSILNVPAKKAERSYLENYGVRIQVSTEDIVTRIEERRSLIMQGKEDTLESPISPSPDEIIQLRNQDTESSRPLRREVSSPVKRKREIKPRESKNKNAEKVEAVKQYLLTLQQEQGNSFQLPSLEIIAQNVGQQQYIVGQALSDLRKVDIKLFPRNTRQPKIERSELEELINAGRDMDEITKHFNRSDHTVYGLIRRWNLPKPTEVKRQKLQNETNQ